jgi:Zn-dependent alcohol dehydrogenase
MQPRDQHPEKSQNNEHPGGSLSDWNAVDRLDKIFSRDDLKGRLHLDDWISARIKLPEINEGFANMKSGKVLRSAIMFDA